MITASDSAWSFPKLTCGHVGTDRAPATFQGTPGGAVMVTIQDMSAIISRDEIAALSALFPAQPPVIRIHQR